MISNIFKGENNMKRTIFIQMGLLIIVFLFSTCSSSSSAKEPKFNTKYITWDETVPDEDCSIVLFRGYRPTVYNGISWKFAEPTKNDFEVAYLKIPAGKANFVCDIKNIAYLAGSSEWILKAKDVCFNYDFLPGKYYFLAAHIVIETEQEWIPVNSSGRAKFDKEKLNISVSMLIYDDTRSSRGGYPWPKKNSDPSASIPLEATFFN